MKPFLVDSSVWIACLRESEEKHQSALNFVKTLESAIVTDLILSEVFTVLAYKEGKKSLKKCMDFLENNINLQVTQLTEEELSKTIFYTVHGKAKLSFADWSLLVVAKSRHYRLLTLDHQMGKAAAEVTD